MPKLGTVFNTKSYTVDLEDGRIAEPGAVVEDVKIGNPHNKALIDAGTLEVRGESGTDDDEAPAPVAKKSGGSVAPSTSGEGK